MQEFIKKVYLSDSYRQGPEHIPAPGGLAQQLKVALTHCGVAAAWGLPPTWLSQACLWPCFPDPGPLPVGQHPGLSLSAGKCLVPEAVPLAGAAGQARLPGLDLTEPHGEPPHPQGALFPASHASYAGRKRTMLVWGFFFVGWLVLVFLRACYIFVLKNHPNMSSPLWVRTGQK